MNKFLEGCRNHPILTIMQFVIAGTLGSLLWLIVGLNREVGELKSMVISQNHQVTTLSQSRTLEVNEMKRRLELLEGRRYGRPQPY